MPAGHLCYLVVRRIAGEHTQPESGDPIISIPASPAVNTMYLRITPLLNTDLWPRSVGEL